jgi:hypothetical protein
MPLTPEGQRRVLALAEDAMEAGPFGGRGRNDRASAECGSSPVVALSRSRKAQLIDEFTRAGNA